MRPDAAPSFPVVPTPVPRGPGAACLAIAAVLLLALPAPAASAPDTAGDGRRVLERKLRLRLWGATLAEAAAEMEAQTGVPVKFSRQDFPQQAGARDVYAVSGPVELGTALEGLARRFGFRYRLSESGRVEVSRGYGWAVAAIDRPALCLARLDDLAREGGGDPASVRKFLGELVKPLALLPDGYALELESYPTPGRPGNMRLKAVLPGTLADNLERAILCLLGAAGDYPVPRPGLFARANASGADWDALLSRRIAHSGNNDPLSVLAAVADSAGVAIVLSGPPPEDALPRLAAVLEGGPTLGQVSVGLSTACGLGRRVFLPCGAVVFTGGNGDAGVRLEDGGSELYWGGLAVAGFDAGQAADRLGGGRALTDRIRSRVFPAVWRDPACALLYSAETRRLAVVAPENVMEAVDKVIAETR